MKSLSFIRPLIPSSGVFSVRGPVSGYKIRIKNDKRKRNI